MEIGKLVSFYISVLYPDGNKAKQIIGYYLGSWNNKGGICRRKSTNSDNGKVERMFILHREMRRFGHNMTKNLETLLSY